MQLVEEVKTKVEKWAVPLGAGGLAGFAAYSLARTSPMVYGLAAGIIAAFLIAR